MINIQPLQPSTINLTNLKNLFLALFFQGGLQKTAGFDKHDELHLRLSVRSKSAVFDSDQSRFYDMNEILKRRLSTANKVRFYNGV